MNIACYLTVLYYLETFFISVEIACQHMGHMGQPGIR